MSDRCYSLEEKMNYAFRLAMRCLYCERATNGSLLTPREDMTDEEDNLPGFSISEWVDGHVQDLLEKQIEGRVSLNSMINFDLEAFEKSVDADIARLQELQKQFTCVTLSTEEMHRRGYRGSWCYPDGIDPTKASPSEASLPA